MAYKRNSKTKYCLSSKHEKLEFYILMIFNSQIINFLILNKVYL